MRAVSTLRTGARVAPAFGALLAGLLGWVACSNAPAHPSSDIDMPAVDAGGTAPACAACSRTADCAPSLLCSTEGYCALQCSPSAPCPLSLPCHDGLCECDVLPADAATLDAEASADAPLDAPDALDAVDEQVGLSTPTAIVEIQTGTYDVGGTDAGSPGDSAPPANEVDFTVAVAQFFPAGGPCLPSTVAGCSVFTCFGQPPSGPAAGTITIAGGSSALTPILLTFDADAGLYESYRSPSGNAFPAGTTIAITAAGGAVPAFSTSVVASTDIWLGALPSELDRQSDGTVTWTLAGAPSAAVGSAVVTMSTESPDVSVVCSGLVASGSLALPSAALAALPSGHVATVEVHVQNDTNSTVGSLHLTARHLGIAHTADGDEQQPFAVSVVN